MFKLKFKLDKNSLLIAIAAAGIIITGVLILMNGNINIANFSFFNSLSSEAIAQKSIDFINNNILTNSTKASLVSVSEESGLVKIKIEIGGYEYDSYATKDGKLLFPDVFKLDETSTEAATDTTQSQKSCEDLTKTEKPVLEAYVVSQCPYGVQMQRVLADIVKNIPSLAENIKVRYMGSISGEKLVSMHGEEEAQENLRQICIREENASKYWSYVSCYIKAGDSEGCMTSTGVDKNKISGCMTNSSRGLVYAKEDADLTEQNNVQGSPSLMMNNEKVSESWFGGRTSEAVKTLLCCGFSTQPGVCSQTLNESEAAASFSTTYEGSGSSPSASCQ